MKKLNKNQKIGIGIGSALLAIATIAGIKKIKDRKQGQSSLPPKNSKFPDIKPKEKKDKDRKPDGYDTPVIKPDGYDTPVIKPTWKGKPFNPRTYKKPVIIFPLKEGDSNMMVKRFQIWANKKIGRVIMIKGRISKLKEDGVFEKNTLKFVRALLKSDVISKKNFDKYNMSEKKVRPGFRKPKRRVLMK